MERRLDRAAPRGLRGLARRGAEERFSPAADPAGRPVGGDPLGRDPRAARHRLPVEALRGYGGNLLAVLYPLIDWSRAPDDLLPRLIEQDRAMASSGSYYAVIVARPVRGLRKLYASSRWFIEPKGKRVMVELRRLLRK
jgi:hypothetical protein